MKNLASTVAVLFLTSSGFTLEASQLKPAKASAQSSLISDILASREKFCKTGDLSVLNIPQSRYPVDLPEKMLREHIRWHACHEGPGVRKISLGQPGSGKEFLEWHQGFIARYMAWRKKKGLPLISAWEELPKRLAGADTFSSAQVIRYSSLDALGRAIEGSLHGSMHFKFSQQYNDPALGNPESSPLSFYFWQLHGLIDVWRQTWVDTCSTKKMFCGSGNLKSKG